MPAGLTLPAMSLDELYTRIDRLKSELNALRPLKPEREQKLMQKFRLEWNFNSNHIEGNTLTYGQTELLLIFDKTTGDHEMREYEEMKAHDVAIKMIDELAHEEERPLTETFLKKLNEVILVRPFWKNAITPDGQDTRRLIKVGEYKEHPNHVLLPNGELFRYAEPGETPAKMGDLMAFFKEESTTKKHHPLWLAAMMHYEFVLIHPFDDGNGRIARLLMNYVLSKNDFPPVIIKTKDKREYLNALNKADTGNRDAFVRYIGEQLIWSLELSIKAAKGFEIEERDDIDKEISLFKRQIASKVHKVSRSTKVENEVLQAIYYPVVRGIGEKSKEFDELFKENHWYCLTGTPSLSPDIFKASLEDIILAQSKNALKTTDPFEYFISKAFHDFRNPEHPFSFEVAFTIHFDEYSYRMNMRINEPHMSYGINGALFRALHRLDKEFDKSEKDDFKEIVIIKNRYDQKVSQSEIESIITNALKEIFAHLRVHISS